MKADEDSLQVFDFDAAQRGGWARAPLPPFDPAGTTAEQRIERRTAEEVEAAWTWPGRPARDCELTLLEAFGYILNADLRTVLGGNGRRFWPQLEGATTT